MTTSKLRSIHLSERRLVLGLLVTVFLVVGAWNALAVEKLRAKTEDQMVEDLVGEEIREAVSETQRSLAHFAGELHTALSMPPVAVIQRASINDGFDPVSGTTLDEARRELEGILAVIANSEDFRRIRLFDAQGVELVGVVNTPVAASPDGTQLAEWWNTGPAAIEHADMTGETHVSLFQAAQDGSDPGASSTVFGFWAPLFNAGGHTVGALLLEVDPGQLLGDLAIGRDGAEFFLITSDGRIVATHNALTDHDDLAQHAASAASAGLTGSSQFADGDHLLAFAPLASEGYWLPDRWHLLALSPNPGVSLKPIVELVVQSLVLLAIASALAYWLLRLVDRSRVTEARYRTLVEKSPDGTMLLVNEQIMFANYAAAKLFGAANPAGIEGINAAVFVHPDSLPVIGQIVLAAAAGSDRLFEMDIVGLDGQRRTVESIGIESAFEGQPALQVVFRDISERRKLERQLAEAQKLESIGQLAAGIAHEINTPTQFVGDNVRFLRDAFESLQPLHESHANLLALAEATGNVSPELIAAARSAVELSDIDYLAGEIPAAIEQTLEGVQRVTSIVRSMKEFSHPGSGTKEPTDLNRAIETTVTVARNEWKYAADLELELAEQLPPVPCLVGELNQAFLNLIINAAHAIKEVTDEQHKGLIVIATTLEGEWVQVRITDTGPGIPDDIRDRIFDPFFTTKEVGRGTGQGLAIARSAIVDKHGGTLTVESELGVGTTFIIRLPLREDAARAA